MRRHAWPLLALALLTASGFVYFPGHTWLQSDTQIYAPILERLNDSTLFEKEILAQRPHVSFTIYDETAIGLRRLTGLSFRDVLAAQQVIFRFCALIGVYLIALSLGLGAIGGAGGFACAVLVAACLGLGATIVGPSVLIFEYEPVPRGCAVGLTLLAIGLVAQGRHHAAGCAAALAFLYHVPAVYPYWIACLALAFLPRTPEKKREYLRGVGVMLIGVALMLLFSKMQIGEREPQDFFSKISDVQEKMMRERASYNWVSLWSSRFYWQYIVLWSIMLAALWRLRARIPADLRIVSLVLTTVAMLSMPASYLLLEQMKWSLLTQFQPMRSVLYVTVFAIIFSACAGVAAAQHKRWWECAAWFLVAFAPPSLTRSFHSLFEAGFGKNRAAVIVVALLVAAALWAWQKWKHGWTAVIAAALSLAFFIPGISGVTNYPALHTAELKDLSRWARTQTSKDALFLFPDAARGLQPGVFRAESLRALYVDWKGGGQINFLRDFMSIWQPRWQQAMMPRFEPSHVDRYRTFGVDYIVVSRENAVSDAQPVYSNAKYLVYRIP